MQSIGKDLQKAIDTIEVSKKDEVYLKISCEPGIAQELCDYFTFIVPGFTFMPAYRMKIWDGKIRLFNIHNRVLYGGLLEYVFKFAENRHYKVFPSSDNTKFLIYLFLFSCPTINSNSSAYLIFLN